MLVSGKVVMHHRMGCPEIRPVSSARDSLGRAIYSESGHPAGCPGILAGMITAA
jgi:hypothetical protein